MKNLCLPSRVAIVDVSPRDVLQMEPKFVPTEKKIGLIEALVAAGIQRIEVTSFVSPKWVPQLADAERVLSRLSHLGAAFQVLTPNEKGYERASKTGSLREATFVVAATETLNRKNVNMSIGDSMRQFVTMAERAKKEGVRVRGTVAVAFVCPHEGRVPCGHSVKLASQFFKLGADEVALADTLGAATPDHVFEAFARIKDAWPDMSIAGHFHDTQRLALVNVLAAMQAGVDIFDSSAGGIGGCQFTKGAKGNVATERLVYMLKGMGIETGIDYDRLLAAARLAQELVNPSFTEAQ